MLAILQITNVRHNLQCTTISTDMYDNNIIIIIIAKTSKAPITGAQRRRTVHAYT